MSVQELMIDDARIGTFLETKSCEYFYTPLFLRFLTDSFDIRARYICVIEKEKIVSLLPVCFVDSVLFGSKLLASGYLEYGGFVGAKEGVVSILLYLHQTYGEKYGLLEVRSFDRNFEEVLGKELVRRDLYSRFTVDLSSGEEAVWKGIQKSKRKAVRRGERECVVRELEPGDIDEFYCLYLRNMKRFGSPAYSEGYFENFFSMINGKIGKVFGAFCNGKLAAGLLGFYYGDRVHIVIAVSDPLFSGARATDAVHWTFIKWAIENGFDIFDFGRVRQESGQFEYKRKWGGKCEVMPSYFAMWNGRPTPQIDPSSRQYRLFVRLWKKLPCFVNKAVGMRIRRGLGI